MKVLEDAKRAKKACARLTTEDKNKAFEFMAEALLEDSDKIIAANKIAKQRNNDNIFFTTNHLHSILKQYIKPILSLTKENCKEGT